MFIITDSNKGGGLLAIVAIIGPDGSGKTTQAKIIANTLKKNNYNVVYIQPTFFLLNIILNNKNISKFIISPRKIKTCNESKIKKMNIKKIFIALFGYPYALVTYVVMKIYFKNKLIICDRFFYQFFFDIYGVWAEKIIRYFPQPNISFFLDGDLDTFYLRMSDSYDASVDKNYYSQVLSLYRIISEKYSFEVLNTKNSIDEISGTILTHIIKKINKDFL